MREKDSAVRATDASSTPVGASDRFLRTDLACESAVQSEEEAPAGASYREYKRGGISVARLRIESKEGEHRFRREIGTYVTVTTGALLLLPPHDVGVLEEILSTELRLMAEQVTGKEVTAALRVLIAGIGNAHMTADALGPETVRTLPVTRHLRSADDPALLNEGRRYASISVVSPGVLAETGIETQEMIASVCKTVRPDLLIVIDALAARSCERLAATVQLSSTGLRPGSGVGNCREALNRETLGCPVIAIGVPTVVDSSTLVYDALERAGIGESELSPELLRVLENGRSFFVSPKEIDALTKAFSELLSNAISDALSVG